MGRGANFQNDIGLRWLGHQNTGSRRIVGPCLGGVFFGALHNRDARYAQCGQRELESMKDVRHLNTRLLPAL